MAPTATSSRPSAPHPPTSPPSESARALLVNKLRDVSSSGSSSSSSMDPSSSATAPPIASRTSALPATSAPQPQPLPPLPQYAPPKPLTSIEDHHFMQPRKRIVSPISFKRFQEGSSFEEIMGLVVGLNESVKGKKLKDSVESSKVVEALCDILNTVSTLVDETPPHKDTASRFGNPAFRDFYRKVKEQSREWHESIPGLAEIKGVQGESSEEKVDAIEEMKVYFEESWGNEERIDYGSGMELNFLCWILCLLKLSLVDLTIDGPALVLRLFWSYITVMRKLQSLYWLEPAGSHGVWGLDDYHFLPFVFGSAQLAPHKYLRPKSIHDDEILDEFSEDYMYLGCIRFINDIKTASLRWHSPMLDDISSVKTWSKVNEGMLKMYRAEVLSKLPIAQHIFFGSLLAFPALRPGEEEEEAEITAQGVDSHGHVHGAHPKGGQGQHAGWGDCCGIPVPSVFAQAAEEKDKARTGSGVALGLGSGAGGIRRVPFD